MTDKIQALWPALTPAQVALVARLHREGAVHDLAPATASNTTAGVRGYRLRLVMGADAIRSHGWSLSPEARALIDQGEKT